MAICGLFFGLVISPKSQNHNLPTGSIPKNPGNITFFVKVSGTSPQKNTRIFETMGKNPPVSPYMAQKNMQLLYLCEPKLPGTCLLTTRELKSPTKKQKSSIDSQPSRFFPRGTPTSLGPLKGTASVKPWPNSGRGGCSGFLFGIIL